MSPEAYVDLSLALRNGSNLKNGRDSVVLKGSQGNRVEIRQGSFLIDGGGEEIPPDISGVCSLTSTLL